MPESTVIRQVCGDDQEEKKKFRVYLVAHSMGELVRRCYLQNICRRLTDATPVPDEVSLVDKVVHLRDTAQRD